jgi:Na+:H+ antiporter, NhaA family
VIGLVLANGPLATAAFSVRDIPIELPISGLSLDLGHLVTDGLLAIFFFLAAIELKHELRHGELDSARKALVPAVAAVSGVIVPAAIYLAIAHGPEFARGWPIPTATDIAFALGILALVGRALPARIRALLLALAVIDDLIAIILIAFLFTDEIHPIALVAAAPLVVLFGWLSYRRTIPKALLIIVMILIAIATWVLVAISGVHPTVAGVALGLALATRRGEKVRYSIEPFSNIVVLPLFALVSTLVVIPDLNTTTLGPVFWAILIALPVGKLIGISAGALIASGLSRAAPEDRIPVGDLLTLAALGGIGFTVSLLMNSLAFEDSPLTSAEGTMGVLAGSLIAALIGGTFAGFRSRWYGRRDADLAG